jgi:integrase/recombinase XerD
MSPPDDVSAALDRLAERRGTTRDPLAVHAQDLEAWEDEVGVGPFEVFTAEELNARGVQESTRSAYETVIRQWKDHMAGTGRHPACPSVDHVTAFIDHELADPPHGKGLKPRTVGEKIGRLSSIYKYWVREAAFPHSADFNPFAEARKKRRQALRDTDEKDYPHITADDLRDALEDVTHVRDRTIIVLMLKLGLRTGETQNIELADLNIQNTDLKAHYPELGTHPRVADHRNAIHIPPNPSNKWAGEDGRAGNKSKNPRVLPLDDEVRRLLTQYLLIRPDSGAPQVFLSVQGEPLDRSTINRETWVPAFQPRYAETPTARAVTSHFGRHFFSTYWENQPSVTTRDVQYMRGDNIVVSGREGDAINRYIHAYYEDIEQVYRDGIYTFGF